MGVFFGVVFVDVDDDFFVVFDLWLVFVGCFVNFVVVVVFVDVGEDVVVDGVVVYFLNFFDVGYCFGFDFVG